MKIMKINSEQKWNNRRRNKNRKRSKKRRGIRKKLRYHKPRYTRREPSPDFINMMEGDSFWKNYNNVMHWQRSYLNYINSCHLSTKNNFLLNKGSLRTPDQGTQTTPTTSEGVDFADEPDNEYGDPQCDGGDEEEEEEEEFEVTEEMMAFLEQSMKHKEALRRKVLEADAISMEPKEVEKVEEAPVKVSSRDDIEECQTPKERMIDEQRILEMSRLYGKSSAMIMGMETALQLSFNKNCDVYKPSLWPCLPLNLKFND